MLTDTVFSDPYLPAKLKMSRAQFCTEYPEGFYRSKREGALRSAREIVPVIMELAKPNSVIDVGCGTGCWLEVFHEHGVTDFLGVDGSYVDRSMLEIPEERFLSFDLSRPLKLDRRFDLVVSLEVAEHLPPESADIFVESLTQLGPVILFSAAIPLQRGTGHLNEQWPEYWVERFECRNFAVADAVRRRIWNNARIEWWYVQNALVFVHRNFLQNVSALAEEAASTERSCLALVHPRLFSALAQAEQEQHEKADFCLAETARMREENQTLQQRVLGYLNEVAQLEEQNVILRNKATNCAEEVIQLQADVQMHREKVEFYAAEAVRLEQVSQTQRDKIVSYEREVTQLKVELQTCREKILRYFRAADLRNLPLHHLLAALPVNIRRTLTRTKKPSA
jgi:SAM-dependent methyltransferase